MENKNNIKETIKFKNGKEIFIDGPLSEMITNTLQEVYKKETIKSNDNDIVNESIKTDINIYGVLYSVSSSTISCKDLINVTNIYSSLTNMQKLNTSVILILDTNLNTVFSLSLKKLCKEINIPIFESVSEYISAIRNNIC